MNTEILVGLFEIELTAIAPYVLQSCLLVPPTPTPEPEPENVISTPVPPGIEYEALPVINTETQIIDTSPDQLIGCANELPTGGEQQILDSLFPEAIDGDGVVNRDNNDIWTYDGSAWTNVGPTPGPQLVVVSVLPPWNEIVIILGLIKAKVSVESLNYALAITTEIGAISVKTKVTVRSVRFAQSPAVGIELEAFPPGFELRSPKLGKVADVTYYTGSGETPQQLATPWSAIMMLLYPEGSSWLWLDKVRGNIAWFPNWTDSFDISLGSEPGSISFEENGVTVQGENVNYESVLYRAYIFKGKQEAVTNNAGSISTTIYESDAFNLISYIGNGTASTIGHGLGEIPALLIFKSLGSGGVVGGSSLGAYQYLSTSSDNSRAYSTNFIEGFTDSVISIGASTAVNASGQLSTCYAFKQKENQCKIGTYYGNGLPGGQVIDCGFSAGIVLIKNVSADGRWALLNEGDPNQGAIYPSWGNWSDFISDETLYEFTGDNFTVYTNSSSVSNSYQLNLVGQEYLYMALAVGFYRKVFCPVAADITLQTRVPIVSAGVSVGMTAISIKLLAVPPPYTGKRAVVVQVPRTGIRLQVYQPAINAGASIGPPVITFQFKVSAVPYSGEVAEDGRTYVAIVSNRDGQPLESSVEGCIYGLIRDLKVAGLWSKFLTIVPMCAARTVAGALVSLTGRYPDVPSTISDYNYDRRAGLKPVSYNGLIYTNVINSEVPATDNHIAAYVTALNDSSISAGGDLMGDVFSANGMALGRITSDSGFLTRNKNSITTTSVAPSWSQPSMVATTRQNSSNYTVRLADVNRTITASIDDQATSINLNPIRVFNFWNGTGNYRVPFYSIGMGLDLAVLEEIVETFLDRLRLIGLPNTQVLAPGKNLQVEARAPLTIGRPKTQIVTNSIDLTLASLPPGIAGG